MDERVRIIEFSWVGESGFVLLLGLRNERERCMGMEDRAAETSPKSCLAEWKGNESLLWRRDQEPFFPSSGSASVAGEGASCDSCGLLG
jgi:hypothetical protein